MPTPFAVIIENPAPEGRRFTSMAAALRYVRKGKAKFTCRNRIVFIKSEEREALLSELRNRSRQNLGYDKRGVLSMSEIAAIPVVCPIKLVTNPTSRNPRRGRWYQNGPVKQVAL